MSAPLGPDRDALGFLDYRHAVSHAVVALDVHSALDDDFRGALGVAERGDIHVFDIAADAHAVHRTPALIARAPQHYVKFSLMVEGTGLIVQGGRETRLGPGDMSIYDTDRPYSLLFAEAVRMSVVMFPKALLDMPPDVLARLTATRLDDERVGALLRSYVASLSRDADAFEPHVARRLFRTAVDLVGTLLAANLDGAGTGAHDVLMQRILDYIDEHLDEADLSPGSIAAAHFVSVRHLHALFSEQDTTVSTVVRIRRLERCYDDLVDPQHIHQPIAAIAQSHGFVDPAHFSRTFRAQFGVPPSTIRP